MDIDRPASGGVHAEKPIVDYSAEDHWYATWVGNVRLSITKEPGEHWRHNAYTTNSPWTGLPVRATEYRDYVLARVMKKQ